VATSDEEPTAQRPHACPVLIRRRSLGAIVGASRPNGFLRQTNEYGQADSDHASLRTGLDNAEQHDRYLRIRSWGFESLRARPGQWPLAILPWPSLLP
jgi:hypothetical protein